MDTKTSKDKLSNNTKILISRRDTLRTKQQLLDQEKTELKELRKTIKLKIRKDINKFNETKARDTIRQTKSIRKTKSLLNSQQEWIINLKSQNASNITNRKELNENATRFFEKLFSSTKHITEEENIENIDINLLTTQTPIFSKENIERTIDDLKKDKCTGNDGISAEMIIYGKESGWLRKTAD